VDAEPPRSLVVELQVVADVGHGLGGESDDIADPAVELRRLLDLAEVGGGGEDVGEEAGEVPELDIEELPYGVGCDDEGVPVSEPLQNPSDLGIDPAGAPPALQQIPPVPGQP